MPGSIAKWGSNGRYSSVNEASQEEAEATILMGKALGICFGGKEEEVIKKLKDMEVKDKEMALPRTAEALGCDASILIDSTQTTQSEKDAGPNQSVRGFDLIDEAKSNLEAACPGTVSCADIITLATRDSVVLAGAPNYTVPTGRRDGLVSNPNLVNLPGPSLSVSQALQFFTAKKLTLNDMVTLLGAHTVGVAHCGFFQNRLSNFQGSGKPDPTMDPTLVSKLFKLCGTQSRPLSQDPTAFLDQNTSFIFDNEFYNQIKLKRGVMQIDQELALDKASAPIVSGFASNGIGFLQGFAKAIVKMGGIEVLVGNAAESGMDYLSSLLEDCKSETLMLMTPRDGISRRLKSAADFDTVWERFPPFDYRQIRSSFALDKETGKKCFTLPAWELNIAWKNGPQHWQWLTLPESSFLQLLSFSPSGEEFIVLLLVLPSFNFGIYYTDVTLPAEQPSTSAPQLIPLSQRQRRRRAPLLAPAGRTRSRRRQSAEASSYDPANPPIALPTIHFSIRVTVVATSDEMEHKKAPKRLKKAQAKATVTQIDSEDTLPNSKIAKAEKNASAAEKRPAEAAPSESTWSKKSRVDDSVTDIEVGVALSTALVLLQDLERNVEVSEYENFALMLQHSVQAIQHAHSFAMQAFNIKKELARKTKEAASFLKLLNNAEAKMRGLINQAKTAKQAQDEVEEKAGAAEAIAEVLKTEKKEAKAKTDEAQAELLAALATKDAEIKAADEKAYAKGAADVREDYKKQMKKACNKGYTLDWMAALKELVVPEDSTLQDNNLLVLPFPPTPSQSEGEAKFKEDAAADKSEKADAAGAKSPTLKEKTPSEALIAKKSLDQTLEEIDAELAAEKAAEKSSQISSEPLTHPASK
ncbi:hypothetical protein TEA_008035 [Camellia sinensis var. sinensis]|uniref:peroxidase n=1 Tax=Camellia sinensis var. sinensis TaxID=542762 RepID=A0A4S4DP51_CAMSN|nr:hypothetical protein TEA_008035 [Camellia sinensis var. sinensis]